MVLKELYVLGVSSLVAGGVIMLMLSQIQANVTRTNYYRARAWHVYNAQV